MILPAIALSTFPGGIMGVPLLKDSWGAWVDLGELLPIGLITLFVVCLILIGPYIRRFGRISNLEVRSAKAAKRKANEIDWLGPPRRSPFTAVTWKQLREGGPIALAGLAGIIAIVSINLPAWVHEGKLTNFGHVYSIIAIVIGFIIAMMIGLGIAFYDVQPQITTFWRSRPINPDLWFWCKFITGLSVLLAAIYIPILLIAAFGDRSGIEDLNIREAYLLPLGHAALFASAVAMLCLVRHAIYAGILSIAFMYACMSLVFGLWYVAALFGWVGKDPTTFWEPTTNEMATALITSFVISTALAWLATRYDWGRKSRY